MQTEMVGGLLLPVGLWLLLSASTPGQLHRRLAAASLIATAIATLAFIACGFALAFGGRELSLGIGDPSERWIFLGASGFLLDGATDQEGLSLFVRFWPLFVAGALLVAGVLAQQARIQALAVFTVAVAGFILPVAGCWMWGGGWLSALGTNAGLGRGTADLGHLATVGLVAGTASIAWLYAAPRRELVCRPAELPAVQFPVRAVAGVLLVMASAPSFANAFSPDASTLAMGHFVNGSVAVSVAILATGIYTVFTTQRADVLSASRAALAAVFITSSGGALLPMPIVVALGGICGLLATIGYYAINEKLRWRDDSAIVTAIFAPAAIGLLATGVFANGAFGVAGVLSRSAEFAAGQLLAQLIGLGAIVAFSLGMSGIALRLIRLTRLELIIPTEMVYSQPPAAQPTLSSVAVAAAEFTDPAQQVNFTYTPTPETTDDADIARHISDDGEPVEAETVTAASQQRARGWFGRFRRSEVPPSQPRQPRKVAYPYRVGGRPLVIHPPSTDGSAGRDDASPRDDRD